MTKEECLKALDNLSRYADIGRAKHRAGGCVVDNFVSNNEDVIYNLICDNFDNPPLKFEELEVGMWVWDNTKKWWIKVLEIRVANNEDDVFAEGIKIIKLGYHVFNWQEFIFEENRFYRKQVEE